MRKVCDSKCKWDNYKWFKNWDRKQKWTNSLCLVSYIQGFLCMVTALNSNEICRDLSPSRLLGSPLGESLWLCTRDVASRCLRGLRKDLRGAFKLELAGGMAQGGAGREWSLGQSGTHLTPFIPSSLVHCSKNAGFPFTSWGWHLGDTSSECSSAAR